jgi:rhamnogalacturonyl hydrolase YesR
MKKTYLLKLIVIVSLFLLCTNCRRSNKSFDVPDADRQLDRITEKYALLSNLVSLQYTTLTSRFPRSLKIDGSLRMVGPSDWSSGFYPGILWMIYDYSQDEKWKDQAIRFTGYLEDQKYNTSGHDIGIKMMSSYGKAFRQTGEKRYFVVLEEAARSLSDRFNSELGCIASWNDPDKLRAFPVTIDNLMSLELLTWAFKQTGDQVYMNIVNSHAHLTMKEHIRSNNSVCQVVDFDPVSGKVISRQNRHGAAENSDWARGQAKAVYGFTLLYEATQKPEYLETAEQLANYYLNHPNMPEDKIPYWDLRAPGIPDEPRDASAAAIMASALIDLSRWSEKNNRYHQLAVEMIQTLSSPAYFNLPGNKQPFLIRHVTISKPDTLEVDSSSVMADYFYLEALLKLRKNLKETY